MAGCLFADGTAINGEAHPEGSQPEDEKKEIKKVKFCSENLH